MEREMVHERERVKTHSSSSSKPSPNSFATLFRFFKEILPVPSSSNRANARRISSSGSRAARRSATILMRGKRVWRWEKEFSGTSEKEDVAVAVWDLESEIKMDYKSRKQSWFIQRREDWIESKPFANSAISIFDLYLFLHSNQSYHFHSIQSELLISSRCHTH